MKLPSFSIKIKYLHIERKYESDKIILPIGCDCHPAYVLKRMYLRKHSLPFDWLGISPETTLFYVLDCIKTKFSKAFSDMILNDDKCVVSRNYPYTRFTHEACIIHNKQLLDLFIMKGEIFSKLADVADVYYLCNLKIAPFCDKEKVDKFILDVITFIEFIKEKDTLHIYLTSDVDEKENYEVREYMLSKLQQRAKVKAVYYYKNQTKYGIWGDTRYYPILLRELGINIKKTSKVKFLSRP